MFEDDWGVGAVERHKTNEVDKLMRLEAPCERFALGALALFALGAAAASLVGVNRSLSFDGEFHRAGGGWSASLNAAASVARQIEPGMAARIELVTPSGAVLVLPGEVVAPRPAPPYGTSPGEPPAPDAHALRIEVAADTGTLDPTVPDGSPCRVIIPLGRQPILSALAQA